MQARACAAGEAEREAATRRADLALAEAQRRAELAVEAEADARADAARAREQAAQDAAAAEVGFTLLLPDAAAAKHAITRLCCEGGGQSSQ